MSTHDAASSPSHSWERWDWLWSAFFYIALTAVSSLYWIHSEPSSEQGRILTLVALTYLLHTGAILSPMRSKAGNTRCSPLWMRLAYCIALVTIWIFLAYLAPMFYWMMFNIFPELGRWLEWRWMVWFVGIVVTAYFLIAFGSADLGFGPSAILLWMLLLTIIGLSVFGYWINRLVNQSVSRHELIQQLQQTQAELATSERRAGMLQERQRLAHEIHDTLAQGFTSIVMHLEAADQMLGSNTDAVQQHLDHARTTARHSLDQARRVINDLRPQPLDDSSLIEAIDRHQNDFAQRTGIKLAFNVTGDPEPLHPGVEVVLLRVAQEALNNVRKHANASSVAITLSYMADLVMLDVQDNGVGLPMAQTSSHQGYGLTAMRQRVTAFNGTVELESAENDGTTVVVSIPLA